MESYLWERTPRVPKFRMLGLLCQLEYGKEPVESPWWYGARINLTGDWRRSRDLPLDRRAGGEENGSWMSEVSLLRPISHGLDAPVHLHSAF